MVTNQVRSGMILQHGSWDSLELCQGQRARPRRHRKMIAFHWRICRFCLGEIWEWQITIKPYKANLGWIPCSGLTAQIQTFGLLVCFPLSDRHRSMLELMRVSGIFPHIRNFDSCFHVLFFFFGGVVCNTIWLNRVNRWSLVLCQAHECIG